LGLPRHTELRGSQWHLVCHSWMVLSPLVRHPGNL